MLKSLHIENIAVIEKTDIDFCGGFNCLTGETGAGKSIIIDSINAVLGERTSKELIRFGCEKAEVSALFSDLSDDAKAVLCDNGYEVDEDGNLVILRVMSQNGNGTVKINGRNATVGILKEISKHLVNIHGQHDSQWLLVPENHLSYIDRLAEDKSEISEYYAEFKKLNKIRKELSQIETDKFEKQRKTELLKYQIHEIESAEVKVGEQVKLKEQLELVNNYEKTMAALNGAYFALNGGDNTDGAISLIRNAQKDISTVKYDALNGSDQKFAEVLSLLEDITYEIRKLTFDSDLSELKPEEIRTRLDILRGLMLKYGSTEEEILAFLENAKSELDGIENSEENIKRLQSELDQSTERLVALGQKLTDIRRKTAAEFSKRVTETLKFLDMPDVIFETSVTEGRYTKVGCDTVEFMIRTNLGDTVKPLHKIASGGELSRVMLAIKSVLADKDDVDTLIFDEIDTGIGGRAAGKVGIQLKKVSDTRQVICVTHLAQIAAYGENHLLINKSVNDNKTYTAVSVLSYEERIRELARIMSGTELTDNLYNSAKELLDRSRLNGNL